VNEQRGQADDIPTDGFYRRETTVRAIGSEIAGWFSLRPLYERSYLRDARAGRTASGGAPDLLDRACELHPDLQIYRLRKLFRDLIVVVYSFTCLTRRGRSPAAGGEGGRGIDTDAFAKRV
jgi:hypothetical protein